MLFQRMFGSLRMLEVLDFEIVLLREDCYKLYLVKKKKKSQIEDTRKYYHLLLN
jgi:hypothetical protein